MKDKKIHFLTLGCKVNQYETQVMRENSQKYGYTEVNLEEANTVIINTCTVTHKSDSKCCKIIRKAVRTTPPEATIVVTGCLANLEKERIKDIEGVDFILENRYKPYLFQVINDGELNKKREIKEEKITYFEGHTRAFVKIQDGCSHKCSYCKVRLARSNPKSSNLNKVVEEVEALIHNGYKEIVLTGICLGAYGKDLPSKVELLDLLKQLSSLKGDFRLRLSSIEPHYVTQGLMDFMLEKESICSHLHIPLQSGDNRILKLMNRPYKREEVLRKINYTRRKDDFFSFSTDIIVGFPGENETSIENTIELLHEVIPVRTHIFNYSSREGTPVAKLDAEVKIKDQKRWYKKILSTSDEMSYKYRSKYLNKYVRVLTETVKDDWGRGYTDRYINVNFPSSTVKSGTFSKLKIYKVTRDKTLASR